jgi:Holliday junction resolvase RusA-like endonuclease
MSYKIKIEPMGAVRMTRRGKFVNKYAMNYLNYKKAIGLIVSSQHKGDLITGAVGVSVKFIMPLPQSWTKKKRLEMEGKPHTSKPDIDNLLKGCFDSINGIVFKDDNQVSWVKTSKVYGIEAGIEMEVYQL